MGKLPHEPDGVREGELAPIDGLGAPHGRVEGREELILHEHPGAGEPVEQRGLARVGVTGDGHAWHAVRLAGVALGVPVGLHVADFSAQLRDAGVDPPSVELNLRLTWATRPDALTPGDAPTGLT